MFGGQIPHPPPLFKRKNRVEISKFRRKLYTQFLLKKNLCTFSGFVIYL